MARKEYEGIVTPQGIAIYPHLNRPDVYKDPQSGISGKPQYKVNLSLSQEEATPIIEKIEANKKVALSMIPEGKKQKDGTCQSKQGFGVHYSGLMVVVT